MPVNNDDIKNLLSIESAIISGTIDRNCFVCGCQEAIIRKFYSNGKHVREEIRCSDCGFIHCKDGEKIALPKEEDRFMDCLLGKTWNGLDIKTVPKNKTLMVKTVSDIHSLGKFSITDGVLFVELYDGLCERWNKYQVDHKYDMPFMKWKYLKDVHYIGKDID